MDLINQTYNPPKEIENSPGLAQGEKGFWFVNWGALSFHYPSMFQKVSANCFLILKTEASDLQDIEKVLKLRVENEKTNAEHRALEKKFDALVLRDGHSGTDEPPRYLEKALLKDYEGNDERFQLVKEMKMVNAKCQVLGTQMHEICERWRIW